MTNLPVWLQEIRDRAEEAQGPWWVTIARGASGRLMYEVTTAPWKHAPNVFPLSPASMEKLVSHPYVPRLIELVGEMAGALERLMPEECYGGEAEDAAHCNTCQLRDNCDRYMVLRVLAKWRGEASNND